jgi:hypothetical protein
METRGSSVGGPARAAPAIGEGGAALAMEEERGIFLRESRDGLALGFFVCNFSLLDGDDCSAGMGID